MVGAGIVLGARVFRLLEDGSCQPLISFPVDGMVKWVNPQAPRVVWGGI